MKLQSTLAIAITLSITNAAVADFNLGAAPKGPGMNGTAILNGSTVDSSDPIASTTVLVYGTVSAGSQGQMGRKVKPIPQSPTQPGQPAQPAQEGYICTGSLIADDILITAAHCVTADPANIRIVFDTDINNVNKENAAEKVRSITGYLANPNYASKKGAKADEGDIALIRISGSLPSGYQAAKLDSSKPAAGDDALLAGYGVNDATAPANSDGGSGVLRSVDVSVAAPWGKTEMELDQRDGKGACHGDSGGPAFAKNGSELLLWGVTSRGYPNNAAGAKCADFVIYTYIPAYADFIQQAEAQLRNQ